MHKPVVFSIISRVYQRLRIGYTSLLLRYYPSMQGSVSVLYCCTSTAAGDYMRSAEYVRQRTHHEVCVVCVCQLGWEYSHSILPFPGRRGGRGDSEVHKNAGGSRMSSVVTVTVRRLLWRTGVPNLEILLLRGTAVPRGGFSPLEMPNRSLLIAIFLSVLASHRPVCSVANGDVS